MIFLKFKFIFVLCFYGALFSMNHDLADCRFKLSNIPERYRDALFLNVYALCKTSDQNKGTVGIMQLVKHAFKNTNERLSFPNEIIYKILGYSIKNCFLISPNPQLVQNFEELKRKDLLSVLKVPIVAFSIKAYVDRSIRQKNRSIGNSIEQIVLMEPSNTELASSDFAIRITTTEKEVRNTDIENLKKSGLISFNDEPCLLTPNEFDRSFTLTDEKREEPNQEIGTTTFCFSPVYTAKGYLDYCFYKTFNVHPKYSLAFFNRYTDPLLTDQKSVEKCFLHIFDREINKDIMQFLFDDDIENGFCCGSLLFVELVKKVIFYCGSSVIWSYANHRIEIYDLVTKNKVNKLPLALSKKIDDKERFFPLYKLTYVDNQKIYLQILKNCTIVSMNYYHQIMKYPLDQIFINDLE